METVMEVCLWAVPVIMAVGASWPIFFPPRKVRSWPEFTRPLLGALTATAAGFGFLFVVVRPLINAQFVAHNRNIILDYTVDMLPPALLCAGAVVVSYLLFLVRVCTRHHL